MSVTSFTILRVLALACCLSLGTQTALAQPAPEYRGFWVDTFNTRLNTPEEVASVIARAGQARANLLLVQVRRRGDAWYLNSLEPLPDGVAIARDFDPLQELVAQGHAAGLQIHAYVVVADIWHQTAMPTSPAHVFNQHGLSIVGAVQPGRANWLTRTLLPDGQFTSYGGHRFGTDFWLDPGHPDAAAYTVSVLSRLVSAYDVDGVHLDRLQYPDFGGASASSPAGANVGYNDTSLERYRRRRSLPADFMPDAGDATWVEWRREQVTALMRRLYLSLVALKPRLVVSASAFAGGDPPETEEGWGQSEPAARVFQDWRAWMQEGIVDLVMPMVYRPEHTTAGFDSFQRWLAWTDGHLYARHAAIGIGAYLNSVEGTLRQARRALAPSETTAPLLAPTPRGVAFFSMGAHNAPVSQNPLALSQRDTPYRAFEDLASGLTTGRTATGQVLELSSVTPVFAESAPVPVMPWKTTPTTGHLMGVITATGGAPVDGAAIAIESVGLASAVAPINAARSDGNGFYGRVGLAPGEYRLLITPPGEGSRRSTCTVTITSGAVATVNLQIEATSASCH